MKYTCVDECGKSAEGLFGPSAKKLQKMYEQILDSHPEEKKRLEKCLKEIYDIGLKLNVTYVLMYNIRK